MAVVTTSAWTRNWLIDRYDIEAGRVHVASPGADPADLAPGTPTGGELLCVATVTPGKGHDVLVSALAKAVDLPWRCVCAGSLDREPGFAHAVADQAAHGGIGARVRFAGPLGRRDLDVAYARADVLVLASRAETFGMVVTEALARGLPVIATSVGGLPEALGGSDGPPGRSAGPAGRPDRAGCRAASLADRSGPATPAPAGGGAPAGHAPRLGPHRRPARAGARRGSGLRTHPLIPCRPTASGTAERANRTIERHVLSASTGSLLPGLPLASMAARRRDSVTETMPHRTVPAHRSEVGVAAGSGIGSGPRSAGTGEEDGTASSLPMDADVLRSERVPRRATRGGFGHFLRSRWDILLVIAAGGALGSLARWGVAQLLPGSANRFPMATFVENVSGAFVLGMLMVLLLDVWPPSRYARPFVGVGLLGGYTTFSTYALETRDRLAGGHPGIAMAYLCVSVVAGVVAVWLGAASVRVLVSPRRNRTGDRPPPTSPESRSRS